MAKRCASNFHSFAQKHTHKLDSNRKSAPFPLFSYIFPLERCLCVAVFAVLFSHFVGFFGCMLRFHIHFITNSEYRHLFTGCLIRLLYSADYYLPGILKHLNFVTLVVFCLRISTHRRIEIDI